MTPRAFVASITTHVAPVNAPGGLLRYVGPPRSAPSFNCAFSGKRRKQNWPRKRTNGGPKKAGRSTPPQLQRVASNPRDCWGRGQVAGRTSLSLGERQNGDLPRVLFVVLIICPSTLLCPRNRERNLRSDLYQNDWRPISLVHATGLNSERHDALGAKARKRKSHFALRTIPVVPPRVELDRYWERSEQWRAER